MIARNIEINHFNWLKVVKWLAAANQSVLVQCRVAKQG